jgi:putative peptidyl-prolyl cis-trans isomerase
MFVRFVSFLIVFTFLWGLPGERSLEPRESLNRVVAIVGKRSITKMDYDRAVEKYKKLFKNTKTPYKGSLKTQVMDYLISKEIIDITADEETIIVNEKRVDAEVERIMEGMGYTDRAAFEKSLAEKIGLPFDLWLEELPYQIKKSQLLQVRVPVKAASEAEINAWYQKNRTKVGYEVKFREIILQPKNSSFAEEERVSIEISQIEREVRKDSSAFNLIASGPRNQSPHRSGYVDWSSVAEIYNKSKIFATYLMSTPDGGVSTVFRDERGRYCLIKLDGRRTTPLDTIRRFVQDVLQREKMETSFDEWIWERRKELPITIFDKEYVAENKIEAPEESFDIDKILNQ